MKYINVQEMINGINNTIVKESSDKSAANKATAFVFQGFVDMLEEFSKSDDTYLVVDITKCKNCVHFEPTLCGWCNEFKKPITADDFCSYGKRLNEED